MGLMVAGSSLNLMVASACDISSYTYVQHAHACTGIQTDILSTVHSYYMGLQACQQFLVYRVIGF